MNIAFVDLKRQNQLHQTELLTALKKIITSAQFIMGQPLEKFEQQFARFCGTKFCVGLNSGTDALEFALRALDIKAGDEIITAPNSYFSSAMVISKVGAKPVFADVDPQTFTIDPQKVALVITKKTKAIIPVHLYGQAADMDPLIKIARQHKLAIIEDCCQAHGARYKAKVLPVTGLGAFSFYPGKNLGSFGDGGALVTNDPAIAKKVQLLRNDGSLQKYHHLIIGNKSRLDTVQAAILSVKLKHLNRWNNLRRRHAQAYTRKLKSISAINLPIEAPYNRHIYHLYVINAKHRDRLQKHLWSLGIETGIHYPVPIHLQPAYAHLGYKKGDFPVTESAAKSILSLPMFPELTDTEINYIAATIRKFYSPHARTTLRRSPSKRS